MELSTFVNRSMKNKLIVLIECNSAIGLLLSKNGMNLIVMKIFWHFFSNFYDPIRIIQNPLYRRIITRVHYSNELIWNENKQQQQ